MMERVKLRYKIILFLLVLFICFLFLPMNVFRDIEEKLAIWFYTSMGKLIQGQEIDKKVLVVDVNKNVLTSYGLDLPISRKVLSLLLSRLREAELVVLTVPINGASGTEGDFALRRVLSEQKNVVLPIWFDSLGATFGGIVIAGDVKWRPWRLLLGSVLIGGINLVKNESGIPVGFYPFFSYKATIIPHVIMRAFGLMEDIDEMRFSFSPIRGELIWRAISGRISLPLSPVGYVNLIPAVGRIDMVSSSICPLDQVLPPDLVRSYMHSVELPPVYKKSKGKICFVGYSDFPPLDASVSIHGTSFPRHHILAWAFDALSNGQVLHYVPSFLVILAFVIVIFAAAWLGFSFGLRSWWGLVAVVLGGICLWFFALLKHYFFIFISPCLGVCCSWGLGVMVRYRQSRIILRRKGIEKDVVKEIKVDTTSSFIDVPWVNVKLSMIDGEDVGGGMYDFLPGGGDRFGLVVADVMDKGKSALTKIAYIRGLLRSHFVITHQPGELVYSVNKALIKDKHLNITCKLLCVVFDYAKNRLLFSGAGGLSFIVLNELGRQVKCFEVEERVPLGVSREVFYEPKEVGLYPGDVIIFYSPAIFSVRNKNGKSYDIDRLAKLILVSAGLGPGKIVKKISKDIFDFGVVKEDCTVLAIEWKAREDDIKYPDDILVGISPGEKELLFYRKTDVNK